MVVKIFYNNLDYQNRIEYVIDFLNRHPLNTTIRFSSTTDTYTKSISYANHTEEFKANYFIKAQRVIFSKKSDPKALTSVAYKTNSGLVHSVEKKPSKTRGWLENDQFQFDLFETIFFHISRIEEYDRLELNEWDLLSEENHFLVKNKLEKRPVIDELVYALITVFIKQKPKRSSYSITHDIDFLKKFNGPFSYLRKSLRYIIRGEFFRLGRYFRQLATYFKTKIDPYDVYDQILVKHKCRKEIYFLIGGKHKYDSPLNTNDPLFAKIVALAKKRGYNLGIHPSYETWKNKELLHAEKINLEKILNKTINISRQHYLRFHFPETISILQAAGINKDSSLGYNQRIGFRCGTGFPYYLYSCIEEKCTNLLEEPLAVMDSSLIYESKALKKSPLYIYRKFMANVSFNTNICYNFHNSRFEESRIMDYDLDKIYYELRLENSE